MEISKPLDHGLVEHQPRVGPALVALERRGGAVE